MWGLLSGSRLILYNDSWMVFNLHRGKKDVKIWNIDRNGKFTVKSYSSLINKLIFQGARSSTYNVWNGVAVSKKQVFPWLVVQNHPCTKDSMLNRHPLSLEEQTSWPFCAAEIESTDLIRLLCLGNYGQSFVYIYG